MPQSHRGMGGKPQTFDSQKKSVASKCAATLSIMRAFIAQEY